jgi:hypothetical protein
LLPANGSFLIRIRRRIIVPGPLPFTRLTALRTSWNQVHDATDRLLRQTKNVDWATISSTFISNYYSELRASIGGLRVDKTAQAGNVVFRGGGSGIIGLSAGEGEEYVTFDEYSKV